MRTHKAKSSCPARLLGKPVAGLLGTMEWHSARVPEDVCVVGVDDLKYARLLSVPLTTLHQPCRELGASAVSALIRRIENPRMAARDILLDFELVVRESSGVVPG